MTSKTLLLALSLLAFAPPAARAQQSKPPADPVGDILRKAGMSRARGSKDAPVTVYEVADFQCPFCAQFANGAFARIDSAYIRPGTVQWVYVNMPLTMHPNAFQAAAAALCAGAVADKFWPMHERLYASQPEWTTLQDPHPAFLRYARALGVPEAAYSSCVRAETVWPVIMRDAMYAVSSQIDGTPTYIIGTQVVATGAKGYDEWKGILDKAIQAAQAAKKPGSGGTP